MKRRELIKQLKSLQTIEARDSWKDDTRQLLCQQIKSTAKTDSQRNRRAVFGFVDMARHFVWQFARGTIVQPIGIGVILLMVVLGSGSFAVNAALDSLPGDTFYSLKRATEKVQIVLARDKQHKATLGLEFADRRLNEIKKLQEFGLALSPEKKGQVSETLEAFHEQLGDIKTQLQGIESDETEGVIEEESTPVELLSPIQEHLLYTERKLIEIQKQTQKDTTEEEMGEGTDENTDIADEEKENENVDSESEKDTTDEAQDERQDDALDSAKETLLKIKEQLDNNQVNEALGNIDLSLTVEEVLEEEKIQEENLGEVDENESTDQTEPESAETETEADETEETESTDETEPESAETEMKVDESEGETTEPAAESII